MSAAEELRSLLDERGVEHEDDEDVTRFFGPDGFEVVMQEDIDGKLDCLTPLYLTPEQAIAATLGPCSDSCNCTNGERTDLAAENARLRAMRDTWAENDAKLRELVRAAYNCANTGPSCLECRIVAGGCTLLSAMRELGIEVEG